MSKNWTGGYQTEVNYTYGYYRELSPNYQKFCLLLNGVESEELDPAHHHCELGFGQGVSLNVHASSTVGTFYGTDFNPAHAAHANMLAGHYQRTAHFYDASFEELLHKDLPMFSSISLHGIWSWISHENQHIILQFIRKYLKPNGIVYISYNCVTGWAANVPIRELFHSHFKFSSTSSNPVQKVKDALDFSEALLTQNPSFAQTNPNALTKVQQLKKQNPNYLIHEYLNQDWQCFSFQQVVRIMEEVKLSFASSTNLHHLLTNINLSKEHTEFLDKIEHPVFREQCRDYFTNTQFRTDLFIRGKNTLTALQVKEKIRQISFVILSSPSNWPNSISGNLGKFNLIQEIYAPLGEYFKKTEYQPQLFTDIEKALPQLSYDQLINALVILCQLNLAQPCQKNVAQTQLQQAQNLNAHLLTPARFHKNYQVLACAITGIGINTDHFQLLFYCAHFVEGHKTAKQFANFANQVFKDQNLLVLDKDGNTVTDEEQTLAIILKHAEEFIDTDKLKIARQLKLFA